MRSSLVSPTPFNVALIYHKQQGATGEYEIIQDGAFDSSVTRAPYDGLFMSVKDVNFSALGDAYFGFFGGGGAISAANVEHGFKATSGGWLIIENGAALTPVFRSIATGVNYDLAIVYDANLFAHYFIRAAAEDWRRVWVSTYAATDPTVFAEQFADGGTYTASTERFGYLGTGLLVPSVNHAGSVPAATTGNAPDGDMLWRYEATTRPSAGSVLLNVRREDASNYWQNEIIGSNGNHLFDEVVAASSINRISAAAAVNNGEKITTRLIGNQATLYSNNTQDGQFTTANTHLRQLGYVLNSLGTGGVVNDLRAWKAYARDESGLGSELLTNPDLSAFTGTADDATVDSFTGWTATGVTEAYAVTDDGGIVARIEDSDKSGNAFAQTSIAGITTGKYYRLRIRMKRGTYTQAISIFVGGVSFTTTLTASYAEYDYYFVAGNQNLFIRQDVDTANEDFYVSSVSLKEITFADDALGTLLEGVVA